MSVDPLVAELVKLRQAHQLSQHDVAHRMGVTPGRVSHIESGYRTPNLATLRKYATAIGAQLSAHEEKQP
ncbi:helix-turn-helix domain-containing protein [Mycobacterium avium]|uniref:helix-turn-helix domain-containing protein n=1 Tax=Mycobacterium avium TaxID=1764 RepID=UPI000CE2BBC7